MADFTTLFRFTLDDRVSRGITRLNDKLKQTVEATDKQKKSFRSLNQVLEDHSAALLSIDAIRNTGQQLSETGRGLRDALAAPVNVAIRFEKTMAEVKAVTGATEEEMASLAETSERLGASSIFTSNRAGQAMIEFGRAGLSTTEILAAMPATIQLATASGSDLGQTALKATDILAGFGIEAEHFGTVGDKLVKTFTTSNTTLDSLHAALSYAAPSAKAAGVEIEELLGMVGLLGNAGVQGSRAGTALSAGIARLAAPTGAAEETLAKLGITLTDQEGNLRNFPTLFEEIATSVKGLGSADQLSAFKDIFGEEAGRSLVEVVNQAGSGALSDYITSIDDAGGITKRVATEMRQTTEGSITAMNSAIEGLSLTFGQLFIPAVTDVATALSSLVRWVRDVVENNQTFATVLGYTAAALGGLLLVSGTALTTFATLKGAVLGLNIVWRATRGLLSIVHARTVVLTVAKWGMQAALVAARVAQIALNVAMRANPIGLVITAITGAVALFVLAYKKIEPFRNFIDGMIERITSLSGLVELLFPFVGIGKKLYENFAPFRDLIDGIVATFTTLVDAVSNFSVGGLLGNLFGGDDGEKVTPASGLPAPGGRTTNNQTSITVNAPPGADGGLIANLVGNEIREAGLAGFADYVGP
ncbi:MAG: phage tail tape measure protein [Alphaproteobacteria bacterium]|nr:phage tail tape measure protein [Alphaproteobacteria bacterium]